MQFLLKAKQLNKIVRYSPSPHLNYLAIIIKSILLSIETLILIKYCINHSFTFVLISKSHKQQKYILVYSSRSILPSLLVSRSANVSCRSKCKRHKFNQEKSNPNTEGYTRRTSITISLMSSNSSGCRKAANSSLLSFPSLFLSAFLKRFSSLSRVTLRSSSK